MPAITLLPYTCHTIIIAATLLSYAAERRCFDDVAADDAAFRQRCLFTRRFSADSLLMPCRLLLPPFSLPPRHFLSPMLLFFAAATLMAERRARVTIIFILICYVLRRRQVLPMSCRATASI